MPATAADICIKARWILPMTGRAGPLEDHALLAVDGRITAVVANGDPRVAAARRVVERPTHLLLPGFVNAHTRLAAPELASVAALLRSGVTTCGLFGGAPDQAARVAHEHGLRAVVGLPIGERPTSWAADAAECITRAIELRDEYRQHPAVSTVFALADAGALGDATLARIATLADELEAGVVAPLHVSAAEIAASTARHGLRPLERLRRLGLATPALDAVHLLQADPADIELAAAAGIAVTLCPQADLLRGAGVAPIAALAAAGLRIGLGTAAGGAPGEQELWVAMRLAALLSHGALPAWDALAMATRGGAAALGLEAVACTLEAGKWGDLCCGAMSAPGLPPCEDAVARLVFGGGRDLVTDVWVAGRPLLDGGEFTRFEWPHRAA